MFNQICLNEEMLPKYLYIYMETMGWSMLDVNQGSWIESLAKGELHQILSGRTS